MVQDYCEVCNQRILYMAHISDYVHNCTGPSETLNNEDVLHFHTSFQNLDGTTSTGKGPQEAMWSGVANKLQGTLAGIMGARLSDLTRRGNKAALYRQRQRQVYKEIPNISY